jgi:Flp pilus assembly protein TadG
MLIDGSGSDRVHGDDGSTLTLMPAVVLVFLILAAIAADFAHAHMARASLNDLAATIANDAATAGLDTTAYYRSNTYTLDPNKVDAITQRLINAQSTTTLTNITADPFTLEERNGTRQLTVRLHAQVDHIFGRGLPGGGQIPIAAESTVTLEDQRLPIPP